MTDCIKEGEVVDQVWAEEGPSLYTRSLRGVWGGWGGGSDKAGGQIVILAAGCSRRGLRRRG